MIYRRGKSQKSQGLACISEFIRHQTGRESEVLFVFAIIETGGKQYKVENGDSVTFDKVFAVQTADQFIAGTPTVAGASVQAKVVKNGKGKKIYILKYKSKKNEKKKIGHRQPYTKVQIEKIMA